MSVEGGGESGLELMDRALGAYLGVAVGDALGATVEFLTAGEIAEQYTVHKEIIGGGWLGLKAGQVTDDTEMALALGSALIASGGWNLKAIAESFVAWMHSFPIDMGNTCRRGIRRYLLDGSLSAAPCAEDGGNGAAMRNLPTVLTSLMSDRLLSRRSIEQARITHHQAESDAATASIGCMTRRLLLGGDKGVCREMAEKLIARHRRFRFEPWPGNTSGYIVDTVQTVLDGFFNTESFEDCLVRVVNRGGDADTTGALAGQLAGALYGWQGIPGRWLEKLDAVVAAAIRMQTPQLLKLSGVRGLTPEGSSSDFLHPSQMRPPKNLYHQNIAEDETRSASSINRCNLPPWVIGSEEFQANPRPIEIDGVRATDSSLFRLLREIDDPEERSQLFHHYICTKFGGAEESGGQAGGKSNSFFSYVHFLRSWGADSNGYSGAVLKAWVESRFGLLATYHKGRLAEDAGARESFALDRMRGAGRTIGVLMQLDLLFTYCQDELARRFPGSLTKTLYRGTHDPEEYTVRERGDEAPAKHGSVALVQLNNLSSFTSDAEVAWEFGSRAWEVEVPMSKIVFFSGLLPGAPLTGESEYLVLGGYYRVRSLLY
jgi:ADP-ribosyl-[dinitrogen reductase] hydrolase